MILEVKTICNANADFFLFKSLSLLISGSASARSSSATAASFRPVIYLDDDDYDVDDDDGDAIMNMKQVIMIFGVVRIYMLLNVMGVHRSGILGFLLIIVLCV